MPVELIFNAPDVHELHAQVLAYARGLHAPDLTSPGIGRPDPNAGKYTSPLVEPAPPTDYRWRDGNGNIVEPSDVFPTTGEKPPVNSGETPKPRRKHRKTKDVATSETKVPVNSDDTPEEPQPEPLGEPQGEEPDYANFADEPNGSDQVALDTIAAEKLKAEVIAQMQDWFAAGKVKMIRAVLDQYGGGAKSFPEIEAAKFVEIDRAIRSGTIH